MVVGLKVGVSVLAGVGPRVGDKVGFFDGACVMLSNDKAHIRSNSKNDAGVGYIDGVNVCQ